MPSTGQGDIVAGLSAPAGGAAAVTPNDGTDLPNGVCRSLYVGGTGNIVLITAQGDTVTFNAVPVGFFPVRCSRVKATLTTATAIVALY